VNEEQAFRRVIIICLDDNDIVQEIVEVDKGKVQVNLDTEREHDILGGLLQSTPPRVNRDVTIKVPGGRFSIYQQTDQKVIDYQKMLGEITDAT